MMHDPKRHPLKTAGLIFLAAILLHTLAQADDTTGSPLLTALKSLTLSGYFQVEGVAWDKDIDTFSLRRARPALSGELLKNLKFKLSVDLVKSPTLLDALVEFEPSKVIGVRIGQFLVPFSLENLTSDSILELIDRAAVVDTLVPGRDNGSNGRDIGAAFYGSYSVLEYTLGLFNGSGINKADTNNHKDWAGRVVLHPFPFLSVGGSLYIGKQNASSTAPLTKRDRQGLEAAINYKRASLRAEYIHAMDALVSKSGWYVQAGFYALPGKLQGVCRYDTLDPDRSVPGNAQDVFTLGVNWNILGRNRLQVNYEIHTLEGGIHQKSGLLAQFQAGF